MKKTRPYFIDEKTVLRAQQAYFGQSAEDYNNLKLLHHFSDQGDEIVVAEQGLPNQLEFSQPVIKLPPLGMKIK
jgi:hypothetical protein